MGKDLDIPDSKRSLIMQFLLESCKNGRPKHGKINEAAATFKVCRKSVTRIWKSAEKQRDNDEVIEVMSIRPARIRATKYEVDHAKIQKIAYQKRGTIRSTAKAIDVPKTVVGKWAKSKLLRVHTNAIKPSLTAPNKLSRLSFSLQAIHFDSHLNIFQFKPMENTIHIDEKWFNLTTKTHKVYMTPMEGDPHRTCQSKKFIPKVMFMCAVSRPVFDVDGRVLFDGKIGIWPFTHEVEAKRDSKKRKKGTIEIKPIESITREVIKDCIIKQIVPAIKLKWPACLSKNIMIQQDNARPHINNKDPDFNDVANADGFQITLIQQPPNSPDVNVNDLGFFRAIQSLQQQEACKNAEELVSAVTSSYNKLEAMTLNKVFLSLQCCLKEIMKVKGQNNYKIPHMKKNALILQNALPTNMEVPEFLVRDSIDHLIGEEYTQDVGDLMAELGITIPDFGMGIPDLNL